MYKRKFIKLISVLLTLCLLISVLSGSTIRAQATEIDIYASYNAEELSIVSDSQRWALLNLYDSETFSSKTRFIDSAITFSNVIYSDMFNVAMCRYGGIAEDTVTNLSDCPAGADFPCRESLGCGGALTHHKDIGNVMDDLSNWYIFNDLDAPSYDRLILILWTSYEGVYCEYSNGSHTFTTDCARTRATACVTTIMDIIAWTSTDCTAHMSFILAHELTHHFGFSDRYNTGVHQDDNSYRCLMDFFDAPQLTSAQAYAIYQDWLENPENAFCDDCKENMGIQ